MLTPQHYIGVIFNTHIPAYLYGEKPHQVRVPARFPQEQIFSFK